MNKFEQELKNNNFVSSFCTRCSKWVWPPSEFCNLCLKDTTWKPVSRTAKLVEFSRSNDEIFCIAEFEDTIRVMGSVHTSSDLKIGQLLNLIECNYDGKAKFVLVPLV